MKIQLIDDARFLWRRWSTRIAAFQVSSIAIWWLALPEEWKAEIPHSWIKGAVFLSGLSFIGAQMVVQPKLQNRIAASKQKDDTDADHPKC